MSREPGCVFCGSFSLTKEHVWPDWLKYVFYASGPGIVHELIDRDGQLVRLRASATLDAQVRRVCTNCNTSWMSQMEDATKPILEPLIRGEPSTLSIAAQMTLAKWLTKTGMMIDLATDDPTVPPSHYRSFRSKSTPLDFTVVLLSSIADEASPALSYMKQDGPLTLVRPSKLLTVRPLEGVVQSRISQPADCYLQTFRLGSFVAQLFWTDEIDLVRIFTSSELSNWHIQAWPNPVEQIWPTTQVPDFAMLKELATRLRRLGRKG